MRSAASTRRPVPVPRSEALVAHGRDAGLRGLPVDDGEMPGPAPGVGRDAWRFSAHRHRARTNGPPCDVGAGGRANFKVQLGALRLAEQPAAQPR